MRSANSSSSAATHSALLARRAAMSANRGSSARSSRPISPQKSAQYRSASQEDQLDVAAVLGPVVATSGLGGPRPLAAARCVATSAASTSEDSVHIAVASNDTSTTEPAPVRSRLSNAADDAEREGHRAVAVTHGAPLADRVVAVRRREDVRQSAPGPERRGVVAGQVGVGTADAVAVATGVDQPRVALGDRLGVQAEARERLGSQVRQEDVGGLEEPVQDGASLVVPQVERNRALPAVGQRHRQVDAARCRCRCPGSPGRDTGRPRSGSTRMTSAPQSASSAPATGTKTHWASSTTRTPSKAFCSMVSSTAPGLDQASTVDLGRLAARDHVDELDGLRHLVRREPALRVPDDLVGRRRVAGSAGSTMACTRRPHSGSRSPMTTMSAIFGWSISAVSTSAGTRSRPR